MGYWQRGKNKYKNKRVELAGRSFASMGESSLFLYLKALEQNNEITELKCQVTVYLSRAKIMYKPDFSFIKNGTLEFAEYKGFETDSWLIKKKLWKYYGPGLLYIYKGNNKLVEIITPEIDQNGL